MRFHGGGLTTRNLLVAWNLDVSPSSLIHRQAQGPEPALDIRPTFHSVFPERQEPSLPQQRRHCRCPGIPRGPHKPPSTPEQDCMSPEQQLTTGILPWQPGPLDFKDVSDGTLSLGAWPSLPSGGKQGRPFMPDGNRPLLGSIPQILHIDDRQGTSIDISGGR